jgi:hypothetical protein
MQNVKLKVKGGKALAIVNSRQAESRIKAAWKRQMARAEKEQTKQLAIESQISPRAASQFKVQIHECNIYCIPYILLAVGDFTCVFPYLRPLE